MRQPSDFEQPYINHIQEAYRKFEEYRGALIAKYLGLDNFQAYVTLVEQVENEIRRTYDTAISAGVNPEVLENPFKKAVDMPYSAGLHEGRIELPDGNSYTIILYVDEQQRVTTLTPLASIPLSIVETLLKQFSWSRLGTLNQYQSD